MSWQWRYVQDFATKHSLITFMKISKCDDNVMFKTQAGKFVVISKDNIKIDVNNNVEPFVILQWIQQNNGEAYSDFIKKRRVVEERAM